MSVNGSDIWARCRSRLLYIERRTQAMQLQDFARWFRSKLPAGTHNPRYELFDVSIFTMAWAAGAYIWTNPPRIIKEAFEQPLDVADEAVWGWGMLVVAVITMICAFLPAKWTERGFTALLTLLFFWGAQPLWAMLFYDAAPRSYLTSLVFLSHASHLWRARARWRIEKWS